MTNRTRAALLALTLTSAAAGHAQALDPRIAAGAKALQPKVVAWRRDIHAHPELGNSEFRTAGIVAAHLKRLGFEVREKVAVTGVVGILRGGRPGPTIALRADMDALPVAEKTGLPFASKATGLYEGATVPVMHACGHDSHVAMLMGAAEVLAGMKADLPGTIVFVFQPAEEGPPFGQEGGALLMVKDGAFRNPNPQAVFGIHIWPGEPGQISYRPEGTYAAADNIRIVLTGKQTHGARPWSGIDVIALGADVVGAINQIAARQIDVSKTPTVITIATVHAGVRHNIIPEELTLTGTLRTFDPERRADVIAKVTKRVTALADSYGAKAKVEIGTQSYPVTYNNPALTTALGPSLVKAAGAANVVPNAQVTMGSEDFPHFTKDRPGLYVQLGARPKGVDAATAPVNHSPYFDIDEASMEVGVRAHAQVALDYLNGAGSR